MKELVQRAREVRSKAYAPYSQFRVGAAVLGEDGLTYVGCNVENASYGLSVCAERNAIAQMLAAGCKRAVAIAVASENACVPCGACLQVLSEFAAEDLEIIADSEEVTKKFALRELLPSAFKLACE